MYPWAEYAIIIACPAKYIRLERRNFKSLVKSTTEDEDQQRGHLVNWHEKQNLGKGLMSDWRKSGFSDWFSGYMCIQI